MPGRYEQLRREMQANFELTWAGQADSNNRLDVLAQQLESQAVDIERQGDQIAEQGRQIAAQGQQIAEHSRMIAQGMRDSAQVSREVVAIGHQMVGRFRLMDDRFGKFLDVLEGESNEQRDAIEDLQARVQRLEDKQAG